MTHGKVTIKDQLISAASFKRMSKNQLIGQILAREATLAHYNNEIESLLAEVTRLQKLSKLDCPLMTL